MTKSNIKFIWKAIFNVEPELRESERTGDYLFEVEPSGKTIIQRIYETSCYEKPLEQKLAEQDKEKIKEIMLKRMIYQKAFSPIKVELANKIELLNRDELKAEGVNLLRHIGAGFGFSVRFLDVNDSITESEEFWASSFNGVTIGKERELLRIASWIEQSETEQDPIKSFILCWIGFNGLYALVWEIKNSNKERNDAKKMDFMISEFLNRFNTEWPIKNIQSTDSLVKYNIISDSGKSNWSMALESATDPVQRIQYTVKCIYVIRKQIFHEAPSPEDIVGRAIAAKRALLPIVTFCMKCFMRY